MLDVLAQEEVVPKVFKYNRDSKSFNYVTEELNQSKGSWTKISENVPKLRKETHTNIRMERIFFKTLSLKVYSRSEMQVKDLMFVTTLLASNFKQNFPEQFWGLNDSYFQEPPAGHWTLQESAESKLPYLSNSRKAQDFKSYVDYFIQFYIVLSEWTRISSI